MPAPQYEIGQERFSGGFNIWKRRSENDEWIIASVAETLEKAELFISRWREYWQKKLAKRKE